MNTVYQEVLSLPFNSEPQGAISKNSSLYFSFGWAYYRRCKLLNTVYQEVVRQTIYRIFFGIHLFSL
ncbi:hypothetical protein, partial [Enterococcus faecium]|uniref:hypothetical protein n=1 Tax=Enterococcus faecium TaxID=1352 RepID=UPI001964AC2A